MNPLEKTVKGGSKLQGKPLEGGDANANKPVSGGDANDKKPVSGGEGTHAKKPVSGGEGTHAKKPVSGGEGTHAKKPVSGGNSCNKRVVGGKKNKSKRSSRKKGGNGFLSHITLPALFVAANTMFGKKKSSKNRKRSRFTKKNRK